MQIYMVIQVQLVSQTGFVNWFYRSVLFTRSTVCSSILNSGKHAQYKSFDKKKKLVFSYVETL